MHTEEVTQVWLPLTCHRYHSHPPKPRACPTRTIGPIVEGYRIFPQRKLNLHCASPKQAALIIYCAVSRLRGGPLGGNLKLPSEACYSYRKGALAMLLKRFLRQRGSTMHHKTHGCKPKWVRLTRSTTKPQGLRFYQYVFVRITNDTGYSFSVEKPDQSACSDFLYRKVLPL